MQFNEQLIVLPAGEAPWLEFTHHSSEPRATRLHFATANGFTALSYSPFLSLLNEKYAVSSMDNRGAWTPCQHPPFAYGMRGFAKDWLAGMEQKIHQPVVGIGHSHGAQVTLHAALIAPQKFSKLILIEPATIPFAALDYVYRFVPKLVMHALLPFIRRTASRQKTWTSRQAFIERYKTHSTFRLFTHESFMAYVEHGLRETEAGNFELIFDPAWESYIFRKIRFVWHYLRQTTHPTLLIRGAQSSLVSSKNFSKYNQNLPKNIEILELDDAHHMLPQEQPQRLQKFIEDWLD